MALTSPPPAPQRGDRTTFSPRMDAFLRWLVALVPQLNSFLSSITTLAVGGANTFSYVFDTATDDSDPGNGKIRLGSSTQSGAVVIRIDNQAASGGDVTAFLAALQAGTSNVKGSIRLQRVNDPSAWLLFDVTNVATASGYLNLTVTPRTGSGAAPFAKDDTLAVFFDPKGDRGDGGNTPTAAEIRTAIGTLDIAHGGTGATTAEVARANLGVPSTTDVVRIGQTNASVGTKLVSPNNPNIANIKQSGTENQASLTISNGGNNSASAVIYFLRENQFGGFIGLDTDNNWRCTSTLAPGAHLIWNQSNFNPGSYAPLAGAAFTGAVSAPSFSATSDERLKEKWRSVPDDFLERFAAIERAGLFNWKEDGREDGGIGAQSIQEIAPWCVTNVDGKLHVNYAALAVVTSHALACRLIASESAK